MAQLTLRRLKMRAAEHNRSADEGPMSAWIVDASVAIEWLVQ
jgi:plasmid stability protein